MAEDRMEVEGPYKMLWLSCGNTADVVGPGGVEVRVHDVKKPINGLLAEEIARSLNIAYQTGVMRGRREVAMGEKPAP
jgi:hypothetical protein